MDVEVSVRPPNSVVLVGDPAGEPPETMGEALVSATETVVAIGTLAEADGSTRIRMVDAATTAERPETLAFEGAVEVPSGRLTIESVLGDAYAEEPVPGGEAKIQVWVNDEHEPDEIVVVVG